MIYNYFIFVYGTMGVNYNWTTLKISCHFLLASFLKFKLCSLLIVLVNYFFIEFAELFKFIKLRSDIINYFIIFLLNWL